MIYTLIKYWVRAGLLIFFSDIRFNDRKILRAEGPLMICCNHPNSFLDAIIIGSHFNRPVHFLARGDAFRKPLVKKTLEALKLIPIYRLSEGREYLALNEATFDACKNIFSDGGIVLIFPEGLCEHQWAIRPLKKGAAKIALHTWKIKGTENELRVLPAGINYNGFGKSGRSVYVNFGPLILHSVINQLPDAEAINVFNNYLSESLEQCMLCNADDTKPIQFLLSNVLTGIKDPKYISALQSKEKASIQAGINPILKSIAIPAKFTRNTTQVLSNLAGIVILALPAIAGYILHAPLYYPLKRFVERKTEGTVFFDSVLFGTLLLLYPLYWLLLNVAVWVFIDGPYLRLGFMLTPLLAWLCLRWKDCWQRIKNTYRLGSLQRQQVRNWLNQ